MPAPSDAHDVVIVLTSHPVAGAPELARQLVERRLAACVQVGPTVRSCYRWKGELEESDEARIEIKTTRARLGALQDALSQLHPYELPELVVIGLESGSERYLAWVREQVAEIR